MRRWVMIAVALVVVLGGGIAAVIFVISNFDSLTDDSEMVEFTPGYVTLEGASIPIVYQRQLEHYISVDFRLKVADEARVAEVEEMLPYIRDAILREVHRTVPPRADGIASVDIVWLKQRVVALANELLHEELVVEALITRLDRLVG